MFPEIAAPICELLADQDETTAKAAAAIARLPPLDRRLARAGRATRPIDVVDICSPNYLHHEMALAAIAAGKHVWCEKPLALDTAEAREIADAAARAGVTPPDRLQLLLQSDDRARARLIAGGEIGTVTGFSGRYFEDYMADPAVPHSWRCERRSRAPARSPTSART